MQQEKQKRPPAKTQRETVQEHLERFGNITSWDAIMRYRITRLAEYIRQIRESGWEVTSTWEENETRRWVRYHLQNRRNK